MFDGEAFGQQMVAIVRGYVEAELAPLKAENEALRQRMEALESRELPAPAPAGVDPAVVSELVDKAVAALPAPKVGESCDMAAVERMISDQVTTAVAALPAPKDGVGLASALKDHDGSLVLVMTDGSTKNLGQIDGKDGETFTLDNFDIEPLDERTIKLAFTKGDVQHSFELKFPVMIYRGPFSQTQEYERGDVVSWGGSAWHCDEPKGLKPDVPDSGWRLMVKRGRDGKDKI